MEYRLAVSAPDKAKDVMDIEVTAEGAGDKRHFSFAAFWRPKFLAKIGWATSTRSPSLLYYDLANVFSKVGVKTRHIGEDFLQHIAIDTINLLDVLCRHLKSLVGLWTDDKTARCRGLRPRHR